MQLRSSRVAGQNCTILNTETSKLNTIVSLVTDLVLLLIMLVGMIRLRRYGGGTFGLGQLMWNQVGLHAGNARHLLMCSPSQGCHLARSCHHS
jgi:hypothetical protein